MAVVGSREFLKSKKWESKSAVTFAQRLSLFHPFFFSFFRTLSGSLTLCRLSSALCRGLIFYITGTID